MSTAANPPSWRTPLVILAAGSLLLAVSLGIRHAFGLFMQPMSMDNGWSRETFGFAIALQNLVWGVAQPFAGRFADRYGAGRAILIGAVLYALGLYLMAQSETPAGLALTAGLLIGIGLSGTTFPIVFGAISRATPPEKRSLAMGISMAIGSLGQFAMLPGSLGLIEAFGWATALVVISLIAACMAPLALPLAEPGARAAPAATDISLRAALGEALRHRGFQLLCFGFFVCGFHVIFIATHLPAYLLDKGLDARTGSIVLALVGLFNIAGSYYAGLWGGRLPKPKLLAWLYFGRGAAITAFLLLPLTQWTAYAFGAVIGLLWLSTVPLTNGVVATLFGVKNLSMLAGVVFLFHQIGGFLGSWLGGRLFDLTGSYDVVWWAAVALAVLAGLVNLPIREQPVARLRAAGA